MERRLVAILSADVVGYSSLMGKDEDGTLLALKTFESEVIEPVVKKHNGRVFKKMGDGYLVEFVSALDSIDCALDWQEFSKEKSQPMIFRIGINLGDVLVEGDDMYGDGINIAARIQTIADPKSVVVSQSLFDQIKRHSSYRFADLGMHSFKNISEEIRLYKVIGGMPVHRFLNKPNQTRSKAKEIRAASIAVLPFNVIGGDDNQQYFADGLTEDIIVELARFKKMFVSSRSASFAYDTKGIDPRKIGQELGVKHILEGQVRRLGTQVRISVQLINTENNDHLWAERYDRQFDDLFDVLDELVSRIVGTIVGRVEAADMKEARRKRPEERTAYDYLLRGLEHHRLGGVTVGNIKEAVKWFDRAIETDPNYGLAYAWRVCASSWLPDFDLNESMRFIQKAIELDENDAESHRIMGACQMLSGDFVTAEYHIRRAMDLNPSDAYIKARSAAFYTYKGEPTRALELIEEAIVQDPFLPVWCLEERGIALFALERYKEALQALGEMSFQTFRSRCYEAACRMALGYLTEASIAIDQALLIHPTLTAAEFFYFEAFKNKDQKANLQNLLEASGLPVQVALAQ
ncbi:MAG: adenylate/guanylate cyclase domain-containing protein [Desulfocapsaceae bacterium]